MCGILGYFGRRHFDISGFGRALDTMANRGPDDRGIYERPQLLLGQTRLAILDLSPLAHQPMSTQDDRYTIVFNGEIYNYKDLRRPMQEEGVQFLSQSDTEVVLHLYRRQGPTCLQSFEGMFALAIWDAREKTLFLARDRLGIKPLYIWQQGPNIAFASEVKAIKALPGGPGELEPRAMGAYLAWGSVPEPNTIIAGVMALPAGHWAVWKEGNLRVEPYWAIPEPSGEVRSRSEAIELLRPVLRKAVALRCISDAPLGAFLSGGIDSSSVVSLMRDAGQTNLQTFSISFPQTAWDEGPYALKVAEQFGTLHTDISVTEQMVHRELEGFFSSMDQPTCDGVNTYLVSKYARQGGIKVSLSGIGGDELFAGYGTFRRVREAAPFIRLMPRFAAWIGSNLGGRLSGRASKLASLSLSGSILDRLYYASRGLFMPQQIRDLLPTHFERQLPRGWTPLDPYGAGSPPWGLASFQENEEWGTLHAVSHHEIALYMRNQLLRDSDVFGMAHGLEIRVPFLDFTLVETLFRIAPAIIAQSPAKALLVESLSRPLPHECTHRSKMGFTFPFEAWMRGPWRAQLEGTLCSGEKMGLSTKGSGLSRLIWQGFLGGKVHWSRPWSLFVLSQKYGTRAS
jgi:asparagine synthase (glutamine-hydrolysing)